MIDQNEQTIKFFEDPVNNMSVDAIRLSKEYNINRINGRSLIHHVVKSKNIQALYELLRSNLDLNPDYSVLYDMTCSNFAESRICVQMMRIFESFDFVIDPIIFLRDSINISPEFERWLKDRSYYLGIEIPAIDNTMIPFIATSTISFLMGDYLCRTNGTNLSSLVSLFTLSGIISVFDLKASPPIFGFAHAVSSRNAKNIFTLPVYAILLNRFNYNIDFSMYALGLGMIYRMSLIKHNKSTIDN